MKKPIFISLLISLSILACIQSSSINHLQQDMPFNKVIIWGHKLHSHSHSYIHYAFYRTFKHLGYEVHWFDDNDNVSQFDFSNSLFITEGQVDRNMPLQSDCFYWLHNCESTKYKQLYAAGHAITLQVYTNDCKSNNPKEMAPFIFYNIEEQTLYMPWATDLLPHEIDAVKKTVSLDRPDKSVYLIGNYQGGEFDNTRAWGEMQQACTAHGITFEQRSNLSPEENIRVIQQSYMAPAIQGDWQCRQGYIPCRIFKNISYGQFGITNSKTVSDLFGGNIIYNTDPYQLFMDAEKYIQNATIEDLYKQMDFVRDNHTYINRIDCLLAFTEMVYKNKINSSTFFCVKNATLLTVASEINAAAVVYVGNNYPENGRMQLELLLKEGLQKDNKVLEIGCGALVAGMPIISFLNSECYVGIDPNKWLIDASLSIKENKIIVDQKKPIFLYNADFDGSAANMTFDYIIAHSIMSHAADWQLDLFLKNCSKVLKDGGKVIFSIRLTEPNAFGSPGAPEESRSPQWVYPGNSFFHKSTVVQQASKFFTKVEEKKWYTELITSTDKGAFHDWFVLTK